MRQLKTPPFDYFVGVESLADLVTRDSRVCVINILGGESRKVTPVSHAYSGGNVVAGVQYGREGALETPIGDIPVLPSVREVVKRGIAFDVGVIYLPPSAVSQAVSELVVYNHDLKRIIIVTEKVSQADSRNIRFLCQEAGVDVVGCNCLGVANVHDHVRIGGALGGDAPEETLRPGSVAIHSNSGNFTTTLAEYLRTEGFGVSTAVSSGKDVTIHFALPEFLRAAGNDPRTRAAALYVEPGGYYEKTALEMVERGDFPFAKPLVVCVTGRWKTGLGRSCGHAGALAGGGDNAEAKESWFDEYFGVPRFDPENPVVSDRGVRVESIQQVPAAMRAVYAHLGLEPDFVSEGDLSLKPWLGDGVCALPPELDLPMVRPPEPYAGRLGAVSRQVGAQFLRRNMRNASGASRLDPKTHVAELHGRRILDLAANGLEQNVYFSLAGIMPEPEDLPGMNLLLNLALELEPGEMDIVRAARGNGALPNAALAAMLAVRGDPRPVRAARGHIRAVIDMIRDFGIDESSVDLPDELDRRIEKELLVDQGPEPDAVTKFLRGEVLRAEKSCTALRICRRVLELADVGGRHVRDLRAFLTASLALCVLWRPMLRKRISRRVVEDSVAYFHAVGRIFACAAVDPDANDAWGRLTGPEPADLGVSFTVNAFRILFGRRPDEVELAEFQYLIGLTLTNGPGTISAKGAKESVSARNDISMAFVGFLANTGLAHGGNGFEAVDYLLGIFAGAETFDPGDPEHGLDLGAMAAAAARDYGEFRAREKASGTMRVKPVPCINHPVFKGRAVNVDPREDFVRGELADRGIANVFLDFYHLLVRELFEQGVTRNVFCVNVDAVLAAIALKLSWGGLADGSLTREKVRDQVFTLFLCGRAIGVSAEIADHRDRGTDMDCRTPQSELEFVL